MFNKAFIIKIVLFSTLLKCPDLKITSFGALIIAMFIHIFIELLLQQAFPVVILSESEEPCLKQLYHRA